MPAQLVALNDGPNILIDKPILLIGRHPECDIQIDSRKISRRHCCIAQVEDYLVVRDLDSTNGIRINGVRVLEGKLQAGDELTVGSTRYRVSWEEAVAGPPASRLPRCPSTRTTCWRSATNRSPCRTRERAAATPQGAPRRPVRHPREPGVDSQQRAVPAGDAGAVKHAIDFASGSVSTRSMPRDFDAPRPPSIETRSTMAISRTPSK